MCDRALVTQKQRRDDNYKNTNSKKKCCVQLLRVSSQWMCSVLFPPGIGHTPQDNHPLWDPANDDSIVGAQNLSFKIFFFLELRQFNIVRFHVF